jgi:hypothetical protein
MSNCNKDEEIVGKIENIIYKDILMLDKNDLTEEFNDMIHERVLKIIDLVCKI